MIQRMFYNIKNQFFRWFLNSLMILRMFYNLKTEIFR